MTTSLLGRPFSFCLLFALALAALLLVPGEPLAVADERSDPDPARYETDIAHFEAWDRKNTPPADPILFVGSSSIRLWETRVSFPDLPVINRGFGGAHISDVNHFASRIIAPYNPPIIVFYCGDNDIAAGKSPQRVAADFQQFVDFVQRQNRDTRIIYLPIKPSGSRWQFWPTMQSANDLIYRACAADDQLYYVDTATPLLGPDGRPNDDLFMKDRLHLNAAGYGAWNKVLLPALKHITNN